MSFLDVRFQIFDPFSKNYDLQMLVFGFVKSLAVQVLQTLTMRQAALDLVPGRCSFGDLGDRNRGEFSGPWVQALGFRTKT